MTFRIWISSAFCDRSIKVFTLNTSVRRAIHSVTPPIFRLASEKQDTFVRTLPNTETSRRHEQTGRLKSLAQVLRRFEPTADFPVSVFLHSPVCALPLQSAASVVSPRNEWPS